MGTVSWSLSTIQQEYQNWENEREEDIAFMHKYYFHAQGIPGTQQRSQVTRQEHTKEALKRHQTQEQDLDKLILLAIGTERERIT